MVEQPMTLADKFLQRVEHAGVLVIPDLVRFVGEHDPRARIWTTGRSTLGIDFTDGSQWECDLDVESRATGYLLRRIDRLLLKNYEAYRKIRDEYIAEMRREMNLSRRRAR